MTKNIACISAELFTLDKIEFGKLFQNKGTMQIDSKLRLFITHLAVLYSGHHGQVQHSSNVKIAKAIRNAKIINSQNSNRFSAL